MSIAPRNRECARRGRRAVQARRGGGEYGRSGGVQGPRRVCCCGDWRESQAKRICGSPSTASRARSQRGTRKRPAPPEALTRRPINGGTTAAGASIAGSAMGGAASKAPAIRDERALNAPAGRRASAVPRARCQLLRRPRSCRPCRSSRCRTRPVAAWSRVDRPRCTLQAHTPADTDEAGAQGSLS